MENKLTAVLAEKAVAYIQVASRAAARADKQNGQDATVRRSGRVCQSVRLFGCDDAQHARLDRHLSQNLLTCAWSRLTSHMGLEHCKRTGLGVLAARSLCREPARRSGLPAQGRRERQADDRSSPALAPSQPERFCSTSSTT